MIHWDIRGLGENMMLTNMKVVSKECTKILFSEIKMGYFMSVCIHESFALLFYVILVGGIKDNMYLEAVNGHG